MRLIIVHNHFRPGGVRRVIELATPAIVERLRNSNENVEVVLAGGEPPDEEWFNYFAGTLKPTQVFPRVDERARYSAGRLWQQASSVRRLENFLKDLLHGQVPAKTVFWAHNQGLGRNLALTEALKRTALSTGSRLVLHHHDWWFDNRWSRWNEMRRAGYKRLSLVSEVIFGEDPGITHIAINQTDFSLLNPHMPKSAAWLPNPAEPADQHATVNDKRVQGWLDKRIGPGRPIWLMPIRLLRRKNIAEALLLKQWLRPEACLVVTGLASSRQEEAYARSLGSAATQHGWPLKLGALQGDKKAPQMSALFRASEAVLLTSLQEGFGLPYLEAVARQRPLVARMLPNMALDLTRFGFRFPQTYREVLVDPTLFDFPQEVGRQAQLFRVWRQQIPRSCRSWLQPPFLLLGSKSFGPVPFNRLTLTAQLEILSKPIDESWEKCLRLNPYLQEWRNRARQGRLRVTAWPEKANRNLSPTAYAKTFCGILSRATRSQYSSRTASQIQEDFIRERLKTENLYPLLFAEST